MSSILSLLQSGPLGEPCSRTRYCELLWACETKWLYIEGKEWDVKKLNEFCPPCKSSLKEFFLHLHYAYSWVLLKPGWLLCNLVMCLCLWEVIGYSLLKLKKWQLFETAEIPIWKWTSVSRSATHRLAEFKSAAKQWQAVAKQCTVSTSI